MRNTALLAGFRRSAAAAGARTAPSIRQAEEGDSPTYGGSSGTTQSRTLTGVLAGSTILVFTTSNRGGGGAITITDSQSGTYTQLHAATSGENTEEAVHIRPNVGSGSITVTQTFANTRDYRGLVVVEVQNCDPSPLVGSQAAASSPGTSGTDSVSTSAITVGSGDINALLVGFVMNVYGNNPATPAPGSTSTSFGSYLQFGNDQAIVTSREITSAGSYTGTFSPVSASDFHQSFAIVLRGSS